ncbi:hypothetical protein ISF6_2239 [Piscinibacter sakaiensis]|uniref:Amine oxidase, flavin-containing n=1 Tax=Piscinibacter sakaiensis TaxID=1547922 RepID=A0A0K8P1I5_PISS1|nr:hypothetical protein ISF6_2239 [Piscinibacter sakaiensis]
MAVIGSGLAGLAAACALKARHEVTLFERHDRLGMDALSLDLGPQRLDVPMRVVYEGYYPTLARLYREAGVVLEPVEYSGTFTRGDRTYLSYRNLRIGGRALPWLRGWRALRRETLPLVRDALRFFGTAAAQRQRSAGSGRTLDEHLRAQRYSPAFADGFLLPLVAGIGTCTLEAAQRYPAEVVLGYFAAGLFSAPVQRARGGVADVVARLSAGVQHLRLSASVEAVRDAPHGVEVHADGQAQRFDHVVLATQADHALRLLPAGDGDREALACFRYQSSTVVMHRDPGLAPPDRRLWGPVNFILSPDQAAPMATIWMNPLHPGLAGDVFQTWNPHREPQPGQLLHRVAVQRPVVDEESQRGLARLQALHRQAGRRRWYCGAYAAPGIPLLESAAASGLAAAACIDAASGVPA